MATKQDRGTGTFQKTRKKKQNQVSIKLVDNKIWCKVVKSMQRWDKVMAEVVKMPLVGVGRILFESMETFCH